MSDDARDAALSAHADALFTDTLQEQINAITTAARRALAADLAVMMVSRREEVNGTPVDSTMFGVASAKGDLRNADIVFALGRASDTFMLTSGLPFEVVVVDNTDDDKVVHRFRNSVAASTLRMSKT